jgi:predicted CXXCH cytochrome family protein
LAACAVIALAALWALPAAAADTTALPTETASLGLLQSGANLDVACRLCHADSDDEVVFPSTERMGVQVDLATLDASVHGAAAAEPVTCTGCHQPADNYHVPHEPMTADSLRTYQIQQSENCQTCHGVPHLTSHPGPESESPVICADCHTGHGVQPSEAWADADTTETCLQCHERDEQALLTAIVNAGLFTDKRDNDYCLSCHSQEGLTKTFPNGDVVSVTIDREALHDSVHGIGNEWQALACSDCHGDYAYPHAPTLAESYREYSLAMYPLCAECHQRYYERTQNSVHDAALAEGKAEAAVCTDCHGAHDTPVPDEPRSRISETCAECHTDIFEVYRESVHGAALLEEGNEDVPTCIDCHGVHNIGDPTTNLFRVRSPELCATCHNDEALMAKYDISTDVFETYVADFHGTTVTLFEHDDPNAETNKAVCYDCHGVHDIKSADDPEAGIKANLLETCQKCHPDASEGFADSWTSHFVPSLESNPLVFLVNLFYDIVIPFTVGFFTLIVSTDIYRRVRVRLRRDASESSASDEAEKPSGDREVAEPDERSE